MTADLWKTTTKEIAQPVKTERVDIVYKYNSDMCVYQPEKMGELQALLPLLQEKNENDLFESYQAQTYLEIQVSKRIANASQNEEALRTLLYEIATFLEKEHGKRHTSTHTIKIMRHAFLNCGVHYWNLKVNDPYVHIHLLEAIKKAKGLYWGSSLLQPTFEILAQTPWFAQALVDPFPQYEIELMAVLLQIPWKDLDRAHEAAVKVLLTHFESILKYAADRQFILLLSLVGKLSAHVCQVFPEYTLSVMTMLLKAPYPSSIIQTSNLIFFNLKSLDESAILELFAHLYRLEDATTRYATLSLDEKNIHRQVFGNLVISNAPWLLALYKNDPEIHKQNYHLRYPIFRVFVDIAKYYSQLSPSDRKFALPRLLCEDLYYFAAIFKHQVVKNPKLDFKDAQLNEISKEAARHLQEEVSIALRQVVSLFPNLSNIVITQSSLYAKSHTTLDKLVEFDSIQADDTLLDWISFYLCERHFPQEFPTSQSLRVYMSESSKINVVYDKDNIALAAKTFASLQWENCKESLKLKGLFILFCARHVDSTWKSQVMSKFQTQGVFLGFRPLILDSIFELETEDVISLAALLHLASHMIIEFKKMNPLENVFPYSETGNVLYHFDWYTQLLSRFYNATNEQAKNTHMATMLPLFIHRTLELIFLTFKHVKATRGFSHLNNLLDMIQYYCGNIKTFCQRFMDTTLCISESKEGIHQWYYFWFSLFLPRLRLSLGQSNSLSNTHRWSDALSEELFHSAHFLNIPLDHYVLHDFQLSSQDMDLFLQENRLWTLYYLLLMNKLPFVNGMMDVGGIGNVTLMENTSLWLLKEAAFKVEDRYFSAMLWEKFFEIYFEACASNLTGDAISENLKRSFMDKLQSRATECEQNNELELAKMYRAFATWSRAQIFSQGYLLTRFNELSIFKSFANHNPPIYPKPESKLKSYIKTETNKIRTLTMVHQETVTNKTRLLKVPPITSYDPNSVIEFIPPGVLLSSGFIDEETNRYHMYATYVSTLYRGWKSGNIELVVNELLTYLSVKDVLEDTMHQLDEEHIQLLPQMWKSEPETSTVRLSTDKGPVEFQITRSHVIPSNKSIGELIKNNRTMFEEVHFKYFAAARDLATYTSAMLDAFDLLKQDQASNKRVILDLFFQFLQLVLDGSIEAGKFVFESVVHLLVSIGMRFLKQEQTQVEQMQFLSLFLGQYNGSLFKRHYRDLMKRSYSLQLQSNIQVYGSTLTIQSLFQLFTPQVFLIQEDQTKFLGLLKHILKSGYSLDPEDERLIIESFQLQSVTFNNSVENQSLIMEILQLSIAIHKSFVFRILFNAYAQSVKVSPEFTGNLVTFILRGVNEPVYWSLFPPTTLDHNLFPYIASALPTEDARIELFLALLTAIVKNQMQLDRDALEKVVILIMRTPNISGRSLNALILFVRTYLSERAYDIMDTIVNPILRGNPSLLKESIHQLPY